MTYFEKFKILEALELEKGNAEIFDTSRLKEFFNIDMRKFNHKKDFTASFEIRHTLRGFEIFNPRLILTHKGVKKLLSSNNEAKSYIDELWSDYFQGGE